MVADQTAYSLLAMTDAEIDVGMLLQERFAVLVETELRHSVNPKAKPEPSQQLDVADSTLPPALQMLKAQRHITPPLRKRVNEPHGLSLSQLGNVVVKAKDLLVIFHNFTISQFYNLSSIVRLSNCQIS